MIPSRIESEAEPIAEHSRRRRGRLHRRQGRRSSAHVADAVAPSPARAEPHDATAWLPLPAPDSLPRVDELLTPDAAPPFPDAPPAAPAVGPPTAPAVEPPAGPGRAEAPDATTWLPLPEVHDLPPIHDLLDPGAASPPRDIPAQPSPARAEPHDATAWLPLPSHELPEPTPSPAPGPSPERHRLRPHLPTRHTVARLTLFVLGAATLVAAYFGVTMLVDPGADVTVRADGTVSEVETGVSTVASLLEEQKIALGAHDRVTPPAGAEIENGMTVRVFRAFAVPVDFDGEPRTLYSTYERPDDFVAEAAAQLDLAPKAVALRDAPDEITPESSLVLRTKKVGTLLVDGSAVNYDSPSLTVAELLEQYKVLLQPNDFTSIGGDGDAIALDAELPDNASIEVVRVAGTTRRVLEEYTLPDERLPDPNLEVGQSRIQERVVGTQWVTYAVELHDGREVGVPTPISYVPVKQAQAYIEFFGTKYNPLWDKMAQCETGGNWSASGERYQGGLGIYFQNWNHFGGREFAPTAGQATKLEQIIVAERIREQHGWHAWGCAKTIGL